MQWDFEAKLGSREKKLQQIQSREIMKLNWLADTLSGKKNLFI